MNKEMLMKTEIEKRMETLGEILSLIISVQSTSHDVAGHRIRAEMKFLKTLLVLLETKEGE